MSETEGGSGGRRWRIELLGGLRGERGDRAVARFPTQKAGGLLAYLAYHPDQTHRREVLIEQLWPEVAAEKGRHNLRQTLFLLRQQFEPAGAPGGAIFLADRASVGVCAHAITTDVAEFGAALQSAKRAATATAQIPLLARAAELYRGELLPGYFDDWVMQERQWLNEQYFAALGQLLGHLEGAGELEGALEYARQGVRVDPLREEAHHDLIRLLVAAGSREAALGQYEELARLMEEQLGAEPSPEIQAFAAELRAPAPPADPARAACAAPPAVAAPRGNLPFRLTRFFGRRQEIARLRALLQTKGTRLVTLTGPGGSGKTRLAQETVGRLRKVWPGGIWFVPLQELTDAQLIAGSILDALGVPRAATVEPLAQLVTVLSDQPRLLVLDNFEHLVSGGAPLVRTLLERIAPLTMLVTSRQRLGLPGERQFPVPPLPVPVEGVGCGVWGVGSGTVASVDPYTLHPTPYTLTQCPSVRLFVDRAQAVRPDFQVTPANAPAVARLCAQLEGLPLALELAAARAGVLTSTQMLARLEQRFELLVSRQPEADPRHRSLRAALDWSYQLLSPELRRFFAGLSVFRGGWTVEAAETICGEGCRVKAGTREAGDGCREEPDSQPYTLHPSPYTLSALEELRECSLVLAEEGAGEMRYRLLETLREYGAEQLAPGERAALAERHARFYLALAEGEAPELERLAVEHDNLRAALEWMTKTGEAELGFRLGRRLAHFWCVRGHLSEGRERLAALLALPEGASRTAARADALRTAGDLAQAQSDYAPARGLLEESLVIYRELGDRAGVASVCLTSVIVARNQGDFERAGSLGLEGAAIARESGSRLMMSHVLTEVGYAVYLEGDCVQARSHLEEALPIRRAHGGLSEVAWALTHLADVADVQRDPQAASAYLEEAMTLWRQLGYQSAIAWSLHKQGRAAQHRGDLGVAQTCFAESLSLWQELGNMHGITECLEGLAATASEEGGGHHPLLGHPPSPWVPGAARACRLFGAAEALREAGGWPLAPVHRAEYERHVAAVRDTLGETAFAAAWAQGRALPLERALALAREERWARK